MSRTRSRNGRNLPDLAYRVLVKIVTLFLIGIAVLAMFGRLKFPGQARLASKKCGGCGRFRLGKSPCPCGHRKS